MKSDVKKEVKQEEAPKNDDFKKALEEKEKQIKELSERVKYLQADFDNLRKYYEKEKEQIIKLSNKDLIKNMLDVLDDFEGAINHASEKEKKGIVMIHDKLMKLLNKNGLTCIKCIGEKFNPEIHEALQKEGDDETITLEFQKGYALYNAVIRPAKVKIGTAIASGKAGMEESKNQKTNNQAVNPQVTTK